MRRLFLALIAAVGLFRAPAAHASLDWGRDFSTELKRRIISQDFGPDVESEAPKKKEPIKSDAQYARVMGLVVEIAKGDAVDEGELAWGKAYVAKELTAEGLQKSQEEFRKALKENGASDGEIEGPLLLKMVELRANLAQIQKALNLAAVK